MSAFLIAVMVVGTGGAFLYAFSRAVDAFLWDDTRGGLVWGSVLAVIILAVLTLAIERAGRTGSKGPCLQWTYGTQFNPATKMTQSYRRCIERGEWVE